jgi:hypothetical protein
MKIILILFVLVFSFSCYSQKVIEYDFYNDSLLTSLRNIDLEYDDIVKFKIKNINTFLYKVEIESQSIDNNISPPTAFNSYLIDIPLKLDDKLLDGSIESSITELYNEFIESVNTFKDYNDKYEHLIRTIYKDTTAIGILNEKLIILAGRSQSEYIDNIKHNIDIIIENHYNFQIAYSKLSNEDKEKNKIYKEFEEAWYTKLNTENFGKFPYDFGNILDKMNHRNFSYQSSILIANTDEITFGIKITPLESDDIKKYGTGSKNERSFKIPVNVTGGLKFDFSPGIITSTLYDEEYISYIDSIEVNSNIVHGKRVKQNKLGPFKYGICALAHVYWRSSSVFNFGGNFGIGILPDESIKYIIGGSLIIGHKKRFILNGGFIGGQVNRLNSVLNDNEFYEELPIEGELTSKKGDWGIYFGFSYNLTGE